MLYNFKVKLEVVWLLFIAVGLIIIHDQMFGAFLPGANGLVGHDFSLGLPALLDHYYWTINNGIFSQPWFTPSFCGGIPVFASPLGSFAVSEFLVNFFDPLTAIRVTMLLFSIIGFVGAWLLLRGPFALSIQGAAVGAALFQFNSFFAHRMIVGHSGFHSFMLAPLLAWLLLRGIGGEKSCSKSQSLYYTILAALVLTYPIWSASAHLLVPMVLAVTAIGLIYQLRNGKWSWEFWFRLAGTIVLFFTLVMAKLVAVFAYLEQFSRTHYKLPGADGIYNSLELIFRSLFIAPPHELAKATMKNQQWLLDRHEFEYNITWVALLLILLGAGDWLWKNRQFWSKVSTIQWLITGLMVFVIATPVAVNIYTPEWNAILKQIPIIKSSSNLVRWFCAYIPIGALAAALALDRIAPGRSKGVAAASMAISAIIIINFNTDREFYAKQSYNPAPIVDAYNQEKSADWSPSITALSVNLNNKRQIVLLGNRNDAVLKGYSSLFCYQPIFGYRLESFPWKPLHPGSVLDVANGLYNMKNPACYVAPEENNCKPGGHFLASQINEINNFVNYRPFTFKYPKNYEKARFVSSTVGILLLLILMFPILITVKSWTQVLIKEKK
ncbi:MAG: hypothetical protein HQL70_06170 [Magnetococcales bacterium]|nr:hypothetical protein [Magnetococcales bacterium]